MSKKRIHNTPANDLQFVTTHSIQLRPSTSRTKSNVSNLYQTIRRYLSTNPNEITYECYDYVELISSVPKFGIWYYAKHLRTQTYGWIAAEAIEYVDGVIDANVVLDRSISNNPYVTLTCSKCKFYIQIVLRAHTFVIKILFNIVAQAGSLNLTTIPAPGSRHSLKDVYFVQPILCLHCKYHRLIINLYDKINEIQLNSLRFVFKNLWACF